MIACFIALLVCIPTAARLAFCLLTRRSLAGVVASPLAPLGLVIAIAINFVQPLVSGGDVPGLATTSCMLFLAVAGAALLVARLSLGRSEPSRPSVIAVFTLGQLLMLAGAVWQFHGATTPQSNVNDLAFDIREVPDEVLVTDAGRSVPVFTLTSARKHDSLGAVTRREYGDKLIPVAAADNSSNCHGWVFTGGRYLLFGDSVETILADNGYFPVSQPQQGDIIVYRDENRRIQHSGLVHSVREGAEVLIESKWSIGERYLHQPQDQCFASQYEYYRSPRATNHVARVPRRRRSGASQRIAQVENRTPEVDSSALYIGVSSGIW